LPLYAASLALALPALSAALWAWRARAEDPDPVPLRRFLRGYRLNLVDSLKIGVPGLVVLTVLATNITYGDVTRTSALSGACFLVSVMVALLLCWSLWITSALSFLLI